MSTAKADLASFMAGGPLPDPPAAAVRWPRKYDVLGVEVSATTYDELVPLFITAARRGQPALATFLPVHGVVTGATDLTYRYRINAFDVVGPDGQPVRWALNKLHNAGLTDRVYGPELMLRLCAAAANHDVPIYLYGSTPEVLSALAVKLVQRCPGLQIAGAESPPFRRLSDPETAAVIDRINASGAGLLFIGLGCPRQDVFAHDNRHAIRPVQLCVGAAFDFHAGTKRMAPAWMQKRGLEWLFRLTQEPGRLWRRYLVTNTTFVCLMARRLVTGR
jgi:N-acetylglucosaminyldiphosphoundecaprenol N-acetyl-beta-D-mannosaminyltransferase